MNKMAAFFYYGWIVIYAAATSAWAYWCTRGNDGRLLESLVGLVVFGLLYWFLLWYFKHKAMLTGIVHLLIVLTTVILALIINPQLDEMGGILNLIIPLGMGLVIIGGWAGRLALMKVNQ